MPEDKKYDLVIGFGEDRRIGLNQDKIKKNPSHIGPLSKEVALATGILVGKGEATRGAFLGYESKDMREYVKNKLQKLTNVSPQEDRIYAAEPTRDTEKNIGSIIDFINTNEAHKIALVTAPSEHGIRAENLLREGFTRKGLPVPEIELVSAGNIVSHINPHFKYAVEKMDNSLSMKLERNFKEPLLRFMQSNPVGKFALRMVTKVTRHDVKETNPQTA